MRSSILWVMNDALDDPGRQAEALFFLEAYFLAPKNRRSVLEMDEDERSALALSVFHQFLQNMGNLWSFELQDTVLRLVRSFADLVPDEHAEGPPVLLGRIQEALLLEAPPEVDLESVREVDMGAMLDRALLDFRRGSWERGWRIFEHLEWSCGRLRDHEDYLAAAVAGQALACAFLYGGGGRSGSRVLYSRAAKLEEDVVGTSNAGSSPHKAARSLLFKTEIELFTTSELHALQPLKAL